MTTSHALLQLSPRSWAHWILDGARDGVPHSSRVIDLALFFAGDLPQNTKGKRNAHRHH